MKLFEQQENIFCPWKANKKDFENPRQMKENALIINDVDEKIFEKIKKKEDGNNDKFHRFSYYDFYSEDLKRLRSSNGFEIDKKIWEDYGKIFKKVGNLEIDEHLENINTSFSKFRCYIRKIYDPPYHNRVVFDLNLTTFNLCLICEDYFYKNENLKKLNKSYEPFYHGQVVTENVVLTKDEQVYFLKRSESSKYYRGYFSASFEEGIDFYLDFILSRHVWDEEDLKKYKLDNIFVVTAIRGYLEEFHNCFLIEENTLILDKEFCSKIFTKFENHVKNYVYKEIEKVQLIATPLHTSTCGLCPLILIKLKKELKEDEILRSGEITEITKKKIGSRALRNFFWRNIEKMHPTNKKRIELIAEFLGKKAKLKEKIRIRFINSLKENYQAILAITVIGTLILAILSIIFL